MPVVAHDEAASEPLVHREVFGLEVAEREDVVAAPGGQETAVTLGPAAVPAVRWVRVAARPPRVGIGVQHAPVRVDRRAAGPGEALERVPVHGEVGAVDPPSVVEVRLVPSQPPEVAVERPVLHHADDDRVDPAVTRRAVEHGMHAAHSVSGRRRRRGSRRASRPHRATSPALRKSRRSMRHADRAGGGPATVGSNAVSRRGAGRVSPRGRSARGPGASACVRRRRRSRRAIRRPAPRGGRAR